jgi:hypothetical protein
VNERTTRWELPAAESQVLLSGPETNDDWVLKAALLELLVRGVLRLFQGEHGRFVPRKVYMVALVNRLEAAHVPTLQAVINTYAKAQDLAQGVPISDLVRVVLMHYRARPRFTGGYVQEVILPALAERGLFSRESDGRAHLFGADGWFLTRSGLDALVVLRTMLETARQSFAAWAGSDHARAGAFIESAGAAVLLMDDVIAALPRLREQRSRDRSIATSAAGALALNSLLGVFGPGTSDGLESANRVISAGVDDAWRLLYVSRGGE